MLLFLLIWYALGLWGTIHAITNMLRTADEVTLGMLAAGILFCVLCSIIGPIVLPICFSDKVLWRNK